MAEVGDGCADRIVDDCVAILKADASVGFSEAQWGALVSSDAVLASTRLVRGVLALLPDVWGNAGAVRRAFMACAKGEAPGYSDALCEFVNARVGVVIASIRSANTGGAWRGPLTALFASCFDDDAKLRSAPLVTLVTTLATRIYSKDKDVERPREIVRMSMLTVALDERADACGAVLAGEHGDEAAIALARLMDALVAHRAELARPRLLVALAAAYSAGTGTRDRTLLALLQRYDSAGAGIGNIGFAFGERASRVRLFGTDAVAVPFEALLSEERLRATVNAGSGSAREVAKEAETESAAPYDMKFLLPYLLRQCLRASTTLPCRASYVLLSDTFLFVVCISLSHRRLPPRRLVRRRL